MRADEQGFTFVESLLVLFITMTVIAVSQVASFYTAKQFIDERTVAQMKYDLLLTQTIAMRDKQSMVFFLGSNVYDIGHPIAWKRRTLPEGTSLQNTNHVGRDVKYTSNGSPSLSGNFYYDGLEKRYKFTIHIGRGRVAVE